jgi:serine/threonine protein kinase
LRLHPHPNIAEYLGCVVKKGRVTGLCFTKYPAYLNDLKMVIIWAKPSNKVHLDTKVCLKGIEAGLKHMHKLGLVHNDITTHNIMMDGDKPIIINFNACTREGEYIGQIGKMDSESEVEYVDGVETITCYPQGEEYARRENDFYGLKFIEDDLANAFEAREEKRRMLELMAERRARKNSAKRVKSQRLCGARQKILRRKVKSQRL